jgi:hypothetical protein
MVNDGFELILKILTTKDIYLSVDELLAITHIISNLTSYYHKNFVIN